MHRPPLPRSFAASDRPFARRLVRPVREFLATEASGGIVLLVAALLALLWANSPFGDAYDSFWRTRIGLEIGRARVAHDLKDWVNDGLMTLFFFVVGLEIKRELVVGELRSPKRAALPAIAALGGMLLPAAIYAAFNAGGEGARGWGIPMATDIAFAVGVLALFGPRIPSGLKVFLLSLAIADDIGAIVVIAIFYTADLAFSWLLGAAALLVLVGALRRVRVWYTPIYAVLGAAAWFCTLESGVHATIAGVALGLLTPARPLDPGGVQDALDEAERFAADPSPAEIHRFTLQAQQTVSVAERLLHSLHPWTSFVIVPLFAVANAGVRLGGQGIGEALATPIALGVALGLVAGKTLGITAFALAAQRLGLGELPEGVGPRLLAGAAAVAGIGFTVALFIAELAFEGAALVDDAKVGILGGSLVAALVGSAILMGVRPQADTASEPAAPAGGAWQGKMGP